jgi:hypothetical protein
MNEFLTNIEVISRPGGNYTVVKGYYDYYGKSLLVAAKILCAKDEQHFESLMNTVQNKVLVSRNHDRAIKCYGFKIVPSTRTGYLKDIVVLFDYCS